MERKFEDLTVGERRDCGSLTLTKEEIIEFAEKYDPQPFHVDESVAKESIYGGLIASGWQTVCLSCRMYIEEFMNNVAGMGGPEVRELHFHLPVRPGDAIAATVEVDGKSRSKTHPDRGFVDFRIETWNQNDEKVLTMVPVNMVETRKSEL